MKIEFTLLEDEARMVQSVFNYLKMTTVPEQNHEAKKLLLDWTQKWLYEMARKAKDKSTEPLSERVTE